MQTYNLAERNQKRQQAINDVKHEFRGTETDYVQRMRDEYQPLVHRGGDDVWDDFAHSMYKQGKLFLQNIEKDPEQHQRADKQLCPRCYYADDTFIMMAYTESACDNCHKKMMSTTSAVNHLCDDCARKLHACKSCRT